MESDISPLKIFSDWYNTHLSLPEFGEPSAMALSTSSPGGEVSSRIVLLKEFCEKNGFVFYTNYDSRKARQLEDNSRAALLFWWPRTGRQVRVEGNVGRVSGEESDRYFSSRPEESRLGAWASEQSREIASGKVLEERIMRFRKEFRGIIPRPPHWGGYRLAPERIEFWQEGEHRLHSRLLYIREGEGWTFKRLAP